MLQNARVTVFTVSELLRESQQGCGGGEGGRRGGGVKITPPPPKLGL